MARSFWTPFVFSGAPAPAEGRVSAGNTEVMRDYVAAYVPVAKVQSAHVGIDLVNRVLALQQTANCFLNESSCTFNDEWEV
jgi:hypothetical protein